MREVEEGSGWNNHGLAHEWKGLPPVLLSRTGYFLITFINLLNI
jgi:hypothetical protein